MSDYGCRVFRAVGPESSEVFGHSEDEGRFEEFGVSDSGKNGWGESEGDIFRIRELTGDSHPFF